MRKQAVPGRKPAVRVTRKPFAEKAVVMNGGHCSSGNGCQTSCNASSR